MCVCRSISQRRNGMENGTTRFYKIRIWNGEYSWILDYSIFIQFDSMGLYTAHSHTTSFPAYFAFCFPLDWKWKFDAFSIANCVCCVFVYERMALEKSGRKECWYDVERYPWEFVILKHLCLLSTFRLGIRGKYVYSREICSHNVPHRSKIVKLNMFKITEVRSIKAFISINHTLHISSHSPT